MDTSWVMGGVFYDKNIGVKSTNFDSRQGLA
jgi:hypothetical protein